MKNKIALHPLLFGLFPILFLYSQNIEQLSFSEILLPSGMVAAFVAVLLPLLWLVLKKNIHKAAMVLSLFMVLFFSYGHVYNMIEHRQIASLVIGRHRYLVILWAALLVIGVVLIIKARIELTNFTKMLNIIAVCLLLVSLLNIGFLPFRTADSAWTADADSEDSELESLPHPQTDIYFIVLDGYASACILDEAYGYDNSEFIQFLEQKGFYVAHQSASNYPNTFLSLASSMNMEYLDFLTQRLGPESTDRTLPHNMIERSRVMTFLQQRGYRYVHYSSGWGPTNVNQHADLNIAVSQYTWSEFQTMLFRTTALKVIEHNILRDVARMRVINTFDQLAQVPHMEGPTYAFAHLICPHPPYVFDRDGGPVDDDVDFDINIWGAEQKPHYLNQLIYLNQLVMDFVEQVFEESPTPPIMIIQADHGPRNTFVPGQHPTPDMFQEGFRILNAYHMPRQKHDLLYDSITPVNNFRVIFNTYFGTDYPLLEDRIYNSFENAPYQFTDITDIIYQQ